MGFLSGLVKTVAAPLVGGVASIFGASSQNASAKSIANNNNETAIELANTAHQREVADLKAAGLNPILSAGGNGAASPSMQGYTPQNEIEPGVSSAIQMKQLQATLDNLRADTSQKESTAALNHEQAKLSQKNRSIADDQQTLVREQIQKTIADYWKTDAEKNYIRQNTASAFENTRLLRTDADMQEATGAVMKQLSAGTNTAKTAAEIVKMFIPKQNSGGFRR